MFSREFVGLSSKLLLRFGKLYKSIITKRYAGWAEIGIILCIKVFVFVA